MPAEIEKQTISLPASAMGGKAWHLPGQEVLYVVLFGVRPGINLIRVMFFHPHILYHPEEYEVEECQSHIFLITPAKGHRYCLDFYHIRSTNSFSKRCFLPLFYDTLFSDINSRYVFINVFFVILIQCIVYFSFLGNTITIFSKVCLDLLYHFIKII